LALPLLFWLLPDVVNLGEQTKSGGGELAPVDYDLNGLSCQLSTWESHELMARRSNTAMMIRLYTPTMVEYLPHNSVSRRVAKLVADVITASSDDLQVEHIGSTAVSGCWGKGIIDLLVTYEPGRLKAARQTLDRLGFQHQEGPEAFPESRPMRVGSVVYFGRNYRLHAHVIEAGADEARDLVRFRDLLRQHAKLRRAYEAEKRAILARGITVSTEYSKAKGDFIRSALATREYD
jgi:GrpB-like predicted nucleotidyltransferase (UPF0157 family)